MKLEANKAVKISVHASILLLAEACRRHNQKRDKWFNQFLAKFYLGVEVVEIICLLDDWRN